MTSMTHDEGKAKEQLLLDVQELHKQVAKLERLEAERVRMQEDLRESEERYRRIVETMSEGLWIIDTDNRTTFVNARMAGMLGYTPKEMIGASPFDFMDAEVAPITAAALERRRQGISERYDLRLRCKDGRALWVMLSTTPIIDVDGHYAGALATITDITERKREEIVRRGQNEVLEMVGSDAPLADVLNGLAQMIEEQDRDLACTILLLDTKGKHLHHGAAPSLPKSYCQAIDGIAIGPEVGSCGTAAYKNELVTVSDITTDFRWTAYRDLALRHGLRACWSMPITSQQGHVLGTFAMYYRQVRAPSPQDLAIIKIAAHIASIAIVRKRTEQEQRGHIEQLQRMNTIMMDREIRILELKKEVNDVLQASGKERRYTT